MKFLTKPWLRPVLGIALGALAGLGYYYLIGCGSGTCPITANPVSTMIYTALVGLLGSFAFHKERDDTCNT